MGPDLPVFELSMQLTSLLDIRTTCVSGLGKIHSVVRKKHTGTRGPRTASQNYTANPPPSRNRPLNSQLTIWRTQKCIINTNLQLLLSFFHKIF